MAGVATAIAAAAATAVAATAVRRTDFRVCLGEGADMEDLRFMKVRRARSRAPIEVMVTREGLRRLRSVRVPEAAPVHLLGVLKLSVISRFPNTFLRYSLKPIQATAQ
ncbi:hypothetical protein TPB0596_26790 [Tsukamurella pulmonis]|nr:hypothetical protein TPB0596_26790 [Tsukamurella pulmonis]